MIATAFKWFLYMTSTKSQYDCILLSLPLLLIWARILTNDTCADFEITLSRPQIPGHFFMAASMNDGVLRITRKTNMTNDMPIENFAIGCLLPFGSYDSITPSNYMPTRFSR